MRNTIIGAVVGAVVGALVAGGLMSANANKAVAAKAPEKQKVVYHINYPGGENDKMYMAAMNNIQNHINAVGADKIDAKVVMHGMGLDILADAKANEQLRGKIQGLKSQQVGFQVCANTLKGRKIDYQKDLYEVSKDDIVPSGVAELARLQGMGYAYIKP